MECTNAALAVVGEPAPAAQAPIVVNPMSDRESMESEELELKELASRITAARSVY